MIVGARLIESSTARPNYAGEHVRPRPHEVALLSASFTFASNIPVQRMRVFLALCTLDKRAESASKQSRSIARRSLSGLPLAASHWYRREIRVQMDMLLPEDRRWSATWV